MLSKPTMKAFLPLVIAASVANALALPSLELDSSCKPVGPAAKFQGFQEGGQPHFYEARHDVATDNFPTLVLASDTTSQHFQFFSCGNTQRDSERAHVGQLRSVEHPNLCVTSGYAISQGTDGTFTYTPNANTPITLRPCNGKDVRFQTMRLTESAKCPPALSFVGAASDDVLEEVMTDDNNAAFFTNSWLLNTPPRDRVFLSDEPVLKQC